MLSCDTFALTKSFFDKKQNLLAKNSDRPLGEAQPLSFFAGGEHAPGETLSCTHLTIPQVKHTYTVLGSRPYWIWGFEMGVNECGLAIGNEAEGSRCDAENQEGLLGMDLLRLALERAATAREGIDVIAGLLAHYGQNANASAVGDRRYENSFMLVDPQEIWLMETAGRQWVARQVHDWAAISNCYTIGTDYDLCSEGMVPLARQKRWLHPDEPVNFAKAYTQSAVRQTAAVPRWRRLCRLLAAHAEALDENAVRNILRDHFDDEIIETRWGAASGTFVSICMHASRPEASQTAASLLTWRDDVLGQISRYAPSLPCCSVYVPVYWTGDVPDAMKRSSAVYDAASLWWRMERLAVLAGVDEARFAPLVRTALRQLEDQLNETAAQSEAEARRLMKNEKNQQALDLLSQTTLHAVEQLMTVSGALADQISAEIAQAGGLYGVRREFTQAYAERTQMPL